MVGDCPDCNIDMSVEEWDIVFCPNCHGKNWFCKKEPKGDRPQYCSHCGWKLYE